MRSYWVLAMGLVGTRFAASWTLDVGNSWIQAKVPTRNALRSDAGGKLGPTGFWVLRSAHSPQFLPAAIARALSRDSESSRNVADVTTRSPADNPCFTSASE